jgi:predicted aspartyl protease
MIGKVKAVALVDTGSSGTFIDSKFALKAGCKISGARTMNVIVANGAEMKSRAACNTVNILCKGPSSQTILDCCSLKAMM